MKKSISKIKRCALFSAFSLLGATSHMTFAQSIDKKPVPINLPFTAPQIKAAEHFVRLNLAPVSKWTSNQELSGVTPSKASIDAYAASLNKKIAETMSAFQSAGFKTSGAVVVSDVGFNVFARYDDLVSMKSLAGIKNITAQPIHFSQRDFSTPGVGAPVAHESGLSGEGQVIAVIDTGIDYTHADFGGSGDSTDFEINDPTIVEEGSFPTNRVVGGYDFAGFDYNAGVEEFRTPRPDGDPLDDGLHGTHVAGIAAGSGIDGIVASGIAPKADLYALKVFGATGSTNLTNLAIEYAMDPNGDGDPSDAVDVINMSLGSPWGSPNNSTAIASQNANDAGIVVVASAGNSGNSIPYVSGSPGSADGVIAVASTIAGGAPAFFIPFELADGTYVEYFAAYSAISPELEGSFEGELAQSDPYDACAPLTSDLTGKIALITRGVCAFTTKLQLAEEAGAIGAIVVNNVSGAPIIMGGDPVDLPAAMISLADGTEILDNLSGTITAELAAGNIKRNSAVDETMSDFSSRGPGPTGLFKPDVSAPGSLIASAFSGSGDRLVTLSGTSMAAPQVAGMAAILRQKFPDLAPSAIKAIIQNTATPAKDPESPTGTPPLSLQGTGIINIQRALQATSYVAPGGIGFGKIKPEYNASVTRSLTVTNFSNTAKRYRFSVETNNVLAQNTTRLSVPNEVYLQAGQSQNINVTLDLSANGMQRGQGFTELDGWILVSSGDEVMRVGYQALVDPASRIVYDSQKVSDTERIVNAKNAAFGEGRVSAFTFAGQADSLAAEAIDTFGFRVVKAETEEEQDTLYFGLNAENNWTNFSRKKLTMLIDTDEDGEPEYRAEVADWQIIDPASFPAGPSGDVISALYNTETGEASLQYFADVEFNSSVLKFTLNIYGDLGFLSEDDTTFNYELTMTDLDTSREAGILSGSVDIADNLIFNPAEFLVPVQQSVSVSVSGAAPALWLSPTASTSSRAATVR